MTKFLTTIITFSLFAPFSSIAKGIECKIVSIPEIAFSDAPMTVTVEYNLSEKIDTTQLHVELKDIGHRVYISRTREVQGTGQETFEFRCPVPQGSPMIVAAWLGDEKRSIASSDAKRSIASSDAKRSIASSDAKRSSAEPVASLIFQMGS